MSYVRGVRGANLVLARKTPLDRRMKVSSEMRLGFPVVDGMQIPDGEGNQPGGRGRAVMQRSGGGER